MSAVLHRSLATPLPTVVRGDGAYLVDRSGKRYLDACGGAAVSALGHSNGAVIQAIKDQLDEVAYAHTGFFTNEPAEELAEFLVARAPEGFGAGRVMFLGSGSEAMEAALKLARQYHVERGNPERGHIIAREMAYHGNTLGALAVGGHRQRRAPYQPLLIDVARTPACYAYRMKRDDETDEEFGLRAANHLEEEILRLGPETVAAFVAEPVSGATLGTVPPAPGYFKRIREICDRYGVLLIADEVMCGMGRTGTLFALEQEGIAPDIITMAKGLGAGYQPIAAVMGSGKVIQAILDGSGSLWNGHTYMSHAVACAGALAVLRTIEAEDLLENVRRKGEVLSRLLKQRFGQHRHVGDIRGRGLFWSLELVADRTSKEPFPASARLASRIKATAQENGLLCYPASGCVDGELGDHVLLAPTYDVTEEQLNVIVEILERTLEQCLSTAPLAA
jgi:adenosylmethionine-8-amino-7-oxononanoate aminotransferase